MADVLSQEEINKLLQSIADGKGDTPDGQDQVTIKFYNFLRPHVFTESRHNTLSFLHEQMAQQLTHSLTEFFHTRTAFHVTPVCELTYEEFLRSIPNPGFLCVFSMSPFPYPGVIEIDPQLVNALIDLLTGGDNCNTSNYNKREISQLDIMLMRNFLPMITGPFSDMWNRKIPLRPVLDTIELNPGMVKVTSPEAMVILVTMEAVIGGVEGMVNICYPVNFIRIPFFPEHMKNDKKTEPGKEPLMNLACRQYNHYRIGNFTLKDLKHFKRKEEMRMDKETVCTRKFTPVIHDKEVSHE